MTGVRKQSVICAIDVKPAPDYARLFSKPHQSLFHPFIMLTSILFNLQYYLQDLQYYVFCQYLEYW